MDTKPFVTARSSDEEIIAAINTAGEHRYPWRRHDWPKEGANNTKSWVKPGDIGHSTHKDPALLKRLKKMVKAGVLETWSFSAMVTKRTFTETRTRRGMFPRFRVVLK